MPAFTFKLNTLATDDPNPGQFVIVLRPDHQETLAHAMDLQGDFSRGTAEGYALLDYPPCWHLAEFRSNRLTRYLPLTRGNLQHAFGKEHGDSWMERILARRRSRR